VDSVNWREIRGGSGNKGRVGGSSRHAQDGKLLEVWVLDFVFGDIGDGEAIVVSEGRALAGDRMFRLKEIDDGCWREECRWRGWSKLYMSIT
jgi:hypothetical protein